MNRANSVMVRAWSWLMGHSGALIAGLAVVWMASTPGAAWGQYWSQNGSSIYNNNGGNAGIGTASPTSISTLPNLGFGAPVVNRLGVLDNWGGQTTPVTAVFAADDGTRSVEVSLLSKNIGGVSTYLRGRRGGTQDDFWIGAWGYPSYFANNVGIGTTNPQYLLSVNGTMGAKDIIVTSSGWSDFVFRPGYRLKPLSEVSAFIKANHHLPDIPSEAEVKEKGVSVGEMQAKLLAKVEELTLHLIQQEKEIKELRQRIAQPERLAPGNGAPVAGR